MRIALVAQRRLLLVELLELERIRLTPADELYLTEDTAQIVVRTAANTPR